MRTFTFLIIVVSCAGGTLLYQYASNPQPVTASPAVSAPAVATDVDLNPVIQNTALAAIRSKVPNSESLTFADTQVSLFYVDAMSHRAKWLVTGNVNSQPFGVTVVLDNGKLSVASATISDVDLGSTPSYQFAKQQEQEREQRINAARITNDSRMKEQAKNQSQQNNETVPQQHYHQPMGGWFQTR